MPESLRASAPKTRNVDLDARPAGVVDIEGPDYLVRQGRRVRAHTRRRRAPKDHGTTDFRLSMSKCRWSSACPLARELLDAGVGTGPPSLRKEAGCRVLIHLKRRSFTAQVRGQDHCPVPLNLVLQAASQRKCLPPPWTASGHPENLWMACRLLAETGIAAPSPAVTHPDKGTDVPVRPPGIAMPDRLRHGDVISMVRR